MDPELILSVGALTMIFAAAVYLVARPPVSRREWPLITALLLTAAIELLDLLILQAPEKLLIIKPGVFVCEALLPIAWALYSIGLSGRSLFNRSVVNGLFWLGGLLLLSLAIFPQASAIIFNPDFGTESLLFLGQVGFSFYLLLMVYLIVALVLLERSFTALSHQNRWCLKFEALGIGAIITMQLFYYSQGLLYSTIDMSLVPARTFTVVLGLMLFFYARLRRGHPLRLTLSRAAAFRSIVLLAVCGYLVFMGLAGEGLRYLGLSSNRALLFSFSLFVGVALCTLMLSESLRRKTKVFLHKHFYRQKYDYRVLWMEMSERLANARDIESRYAAIIEIYCQTFAIQSGALYLNRGGQDGLPVVAVHTGAQMPARIDTAGSLTRFLKSKRWVFNLQDNAGEISTVEVELLKQHEIQFVVPIFFDQELGGVVVLCRQINANEPVIYEDYDLMKIFGRQVAAVLINDRLSRQLADQREMAAVGKVSAFVMHDLKNLVSILSLVVENAQELIHDHRFQEDMLETLSNTVRQMNSLIGRLKHVGESSSLSCEPYNLKQLVLEMIDEIGSNGVTVSGESIDIEIDRSEIGKVITNLLLNGIEASNDNKNIQVEIGNKSGPLLVFRDEGCGMTDEFMAKNLFRPFETTKQNGLGIGLYQCRQIVEAHGGRIEAASAVGKGSEFRIYLPTRLTAEVLSDG